MTAAVDYQALARVGLTYPDNRPDGSGLDDGPLLPRAQINGRKRERAITMRAEGKTLRAIGTELGVSHETANYWTRGVSKGRK